MHTVLALKIIIIIHTTTLTSRVVIIVYMGAIQEYIKLLILCNFILKYDLVHTDPDLCLLTLLF